MSNLSHTIRRFNRFELKYMVTLKQAEIFKNALRTFLLPDEHGNGNGRYTLSSLYYDSPDFRCYWEKVNGIKFRRKLRIRRYVTDEALTGDAPVFVEIKQRLDRVTQKRRVILPYRDAMRLCNDRLYPDEFAPDDKVVLDEIYAYLWQYNLRPVSIMMAFELGFDQKTAKRGGLLHDIGKAIDHDQEGTHPALGMEVAARYGEPQPVLEAIGYHHDDYAGGSLWPVLIAAADAVSGARPGAWRESLEIYIKRLDALERIAAQFPGVEKSYAIQAGREIRIMVEHQKVDDARAHNVAGEIARRIEKELEYPGQIRVTVIRETRAVDYAKSRGAPAGAEGEAAVTSRFGRATMLLAPGLAAVLTAAR